MESEVLALKKRVEHLEQEIKKIERLEKSLAYHEIVLAKKVSEIYEFEKKLEGFAEKKQLEKLFSDIKKLESHEDILAENTKHVHELLKQIADLRQADKKHQSQTGKDSISHLEIELNHKLSQIEYQNRLIMKYLKIVDEKFFDNIR